ncbi:MAG: UDP-N-acetylmuramoyl-tripeptide--D-alanyl-D-alanine ligase [Acidobacteria bacterium]|nr:UDP-N-acetylmuramoyl-tripeptide--D-alanyl-D-alanine ligase [Acidobacteriota bacterium]
MESARTMMEAESSTGGVLTSGSRSAVFSGVSIDSRTLKSGDLFFAIRGPRRDGHDFIPEVLRKGAAGVVAASDYEPDFEYPKDRALIRVSDTHQALKDLAAGTRRRWQGRLVGITGSMGKTTVKEFAAHLLEVRYAVYRSPGNYNNLFGLPLALCGLLPEHEIGILEMGMSAPGEIAEMCALAQPGVGVITNVAPVHLEFFPDIEAIARAKGELALALGTKGTLVYCSDDPLVANIGARSVGNKIPFGCGAGAAVRATGIEVVSLRETRFRLVTSEGTRAASIPFAGFHYVMNALAAVAVGLHFSLEVDTIVESLETLPPSPMRGEVLTLRGGLTLIDDSYNSNPCALKRMIDTVCALPCSQRCIVVAGEMLELGPDTGRLHYECGAWAARRGVDILIAVRGAAQELARGALEAGMPQERVRFFGDVDSASEFLLRTARPGDLVLIKGSRGVQLERIVRSLRDARERQ